MGQKSLKHPYVFAAPQINAGRAAIAAVVVGTAFAASTSACAQIDRPSSAPVANSLFDLLSDESAKTPAWQEGPVQTPPPPNFDQLLPFEMTRHSALSYAIDPASVSVSSPGSDGVVRYTVVIRSRSGATNIRYEGIRCNAFLWRLYSAANASGTAWENISTDWSRIEGNSLNGYRAALASDYMCGNKSPAGTAADIVKRIRFQRTLNSELYR